MKKILNSAEETIEYGKNFAGKLKGGKVLALTGDLGSGKTTFIKGLAEGLKVSDNITSPTFVILKSYPGKIDKNKIEFVHIDAYRVESIEDIKSVGIEDYLGRDDVIIAIEWAEKIRDLPAGRQVLPEKVININFKHLDENKREVEVK
jgi:tRNA threonylcarbamoyladenosine biosynthesis protein TsaE